MPQQRLGRASSADLPLDPEELAGRPPAGDPKLLIAHALAADPGSVGAVLAQVERATISGKEQRAVSARHRVDLAQTARRKIERPRVDDEPVGSDELEALLLEESLKDVNASGDPVIVQVCRNRGMRTLLSVYKERAAMQRAAARKLRQLDVPGVPAPEGPPPA